MKAYEYLESLPPFDIDDAQRAADTWGFNCGPAAICAVVRLTPDELRPFMGDFERKGYTNPTLMVDVLKRLGVGRVNANSLFPLYGLARIQWHGPWMDKTVPIKARYRHTHWVGSRRFKSQQWIFDVNCMCVGGWVSLEEWSRQVAPWIIRECVPRGDGKWSVTHSLEITSGIRTALPKERRVKG